MGRGHVSFCNGRRRCKKAWDKETPSSKIQGNPVAPKVPRRSAPSLFISGRGISIAARLIKIRFYLAARGFARDRWMDG